MLEPPPKRTAQATISEAPLIGLFGSKAAYQVLMYLENYGKGYGAEIAKVFGMPLSQAQNQLRKFEDLGLLVSRREGSSRVFYFKQNPIADSLRALLRANLERLPTTTLEQFYRRRSRPRRTGKRRTLGGRRVPCRRRASATRRRSQTWPR
jgi:DNA-binding MarR family transcriptional regulator